MVLGFVTDAVIVAVVLGVMILVHEWGHFMAAKWMGVRVLIFSVGFGKRLFGFKRGDTDYRLSLLFLGGYVKMAGDDPREVHGGDPGEFLGRPRWQRFVIVLAGPVMNILMAIVLLAGIYRFHYPSEAYLQQPARVGDVEANSPAARAGVKPGDLIVSLDGLRRVTWGKVEDKVSITVSEPMPMRIQRGDQTLNMTLTPVARGPNALGYVGWYPYVPGIIENVESGLPASLAGLKAGDEIIGLNGQKIYWWPKLAYALQESDGKPVNLTILRGKKEFDVQVKPVYTELMGEKKWRIGVAFRTTYVVQKLPLRLAIRSSIKDNVKACLATFDVVGKIVTRHLSTRVLTGPIGIAQMSGKAYRAGIPELLMLVSFISLQLGIFNLLPIPILDGGVILLLFIEGSMRRDLSLQMKERVLQMGILLLLLLAVVVMYNDIVRTLKPY